MLSEDIRLARSTNALHRVVDGKAIILHADSGVYFSLNGVGSRVWELLEEPVTPVSLRDQLVHEFDVPPDVLANDIQTFLTELEGAGLVRRVG